MWDFVERYFLGEDVEKEIDEKQRNNDEKITRIVPIEKYIDLESENTYPLEDYRDWDIIINNIIEEKYKYFCNILKENNKRIPDYAYTDFVVDKKNISSLFIYIKENLIIVPEIASHEVIQRCKDKGWNVIKIDKIEDNLDLIGDANNG